MTKYGPEEDKSDIRIHVGFATSTVFVFPSKSALEWELDRDPDWCVGQMGVIGQTGRGILVPWREMRGIRSVSFPSEWTTVSRHDDEVLKGECAVRVVKLLLNQGRIPWCSEGIEISDAELQIEGKDLIVSRPISIQVKCDWLAGDKPLGSGNLAIQTYERNPLGKGVPH
jgi:hypothetical protein